jgi:hypothetical protein
MSVLKLPLLVDLQQKADELVFSITSCLTVIYNYYTQKCGYGNFNHRYNVSPIHLHAFLGVMNFMKVVRDYRKFEKHCLRDYAPQINLTTRALGSETLRDYLTS